MSVGCVAGIRLDFDLAGVGEIFLLAMVALYEYENSRAFVLRRNGFRSSYRDRRSNFFPFLHAPPPIVRLLRLDRSGRHPNPPQRLKDLGGMGHA